MSSRALGVELRNQARVVYDWGCSSTAAYSDNRTDDQVRPRVLLTLGAEMFRSKTSSSKRLHPSSSRWDKFRQPRSEWLLRAPGTAPGHGQRFFPETITHQALSVKKLCAVNVAPNAGHCWVETPWVSRCRHWDIRPSGHLRCNRCARKDLLQMSPERTVISPELNGP